VRRAHEAQTIRPIADTPGAPRPHGPIGLPTSAAAAWGGWGAPFIVFDHADLEEFRNAGQTCVCAKWIYLRAGATPWRPPDRDL